MLAELAEFGLNTNNRAYLEAILESVSTQGDIAYAVVADANDQQLDLVLTEHEIVDPRAR